ncbi:DNAse [Lactococcus hircilactis]|uniref:DNAse n=2 Tax=Lactococcus hircilactis TaxID=1494462 RepID=A0A7X1Z9N2_9LACT|nr:DNAse [Lactococcus hircilactis]
MDMNKLRKNQKSVLYPLIILLLATLGYFATQILTTPHSASPAATEALSSAIEEKPLPFKNQRQMVLGRLDSLSRATNAHIQLKNAQEPHLKREPLTYNPVGWHNYHFYYKTSDGQTQKAWLMSRGHLVGYQFSGLNNEPKNLVPETMCFNGGNYSGMNDSNSTSMLYYENRLDSWLANHPHYYLDYQVTPLYHGNELVPRQIRLSYVGMDQKGQLLSITLGGPLEKKGKNGTTEVILQNQSPNAKINYDTGTAINTVKKAY